MAPEMVRKLAEILHDLDEEELGESHPLDECYGEAKATYLARSAAVLTRLIKAGVVHVG